MAANTGPDELLVDLGRATSPGERWKALTAFVERWYGVSVGDVPQIESARQAPPLLRKMLALNAALPHLMQQDHLVGPEVLSVEDGKVVFLYENQSVCFWATEPEGEDPRVWYRENDVRALWLEEPERLSSFLVQMVVEEAVLTAPCGAHQPALPAATVQPFLARVTPLWTTRWNWGGARFFAGQGALMMTMENQGDVDVFLAARTTEALARFDDLVTEDWVQVDR